MKETVTKEEWVDMFKEIGLSDEAMMAWHGVFEKRHPKAHAAFLSWLGIAKDEIGRIRDQVK